MKFLCNLLYPPAFFCSLHQTIMKKKIKYYTCEFMKLKVSQCILNLSLECK